MHDFAMLGFPGDRDMAGMIRLVPYAYLVARKRVK